MELQNKEFSDGSGVEKCKGGKDFEEKVAKVLSFQNFKLLRLEEVERLSERIEKFEVESSIVALAEDLINDDTEVKSSTFHTYD